MCGHLSQSMKERILDEANYFVNHQSTIRATAQHFALSKSTIHIDLTQRLPYVSPILAKKVTNLILTNTSERHLRGGYATRQKYLNSKIKN